MKALLIAAFAILLSGQTIHAEPVFPPGSRIGLTPSAGMAVSKRFQGFEDPDRRTAIRLREWPDADHAELVSAIEAMVAGDKDTLEVTGREEFTVNGQKAFLVTATQASSRGERLRKWFLVVSTPGLSAMAAVQSPYGGPGYGDAEMRAVLQTVTLRPPTGASADLAALPFSIGEHAGLRLMRVRGNGAAFTDGPADIFEPLDQPTLTVMSTERLKGLAMQPTAGRERFIRQLALGDPELMNTEIEQFDEIRSDQGERYDVIVKAKDRKSGRDAVRVLSLLLARGRVVSTVGTTRAEWRDRDLPRFQTVIRSIALKP